MNNNFNKEIYTKINELFYHDKKRLAHVLGVADLTFALAARYNVNLDDAYVAGLLHDCAKNYSWEELISISESNNIPITESEYRSPYLLHAKVGALFAKEKYNVDNEDICEAIECHTTGKVGMNRLSEILFIADYLEPNRKHSELLDELRYMAFEDLEMTIYIILRESLNHLKSKHLPIDPMTEDTFAYYDKIIKNREQRVE